MVFILSDDQAWTVADFIDHATTEEKPFLQVRETLNEQVGQGDAKFVLQLE